MVNMKQEVQEKGGDLVDVVPGNMETIIIAVQVEHPAVVTTPAYFKEKPPNSPGWAEVWVLRAKRHYG